MRPYVDAELAISVITEMELLSKPAMSEVELGAAELFLDTCRIIDLNAAIKAAVVTLRRRHRMKLPDAIVAATALWLNVPLLTADKGFSRIAGLDVVLLNPA